MIAQLITVLSLLVGIISTIVELLIKTKITNSRGILITVIIYNTILSVLTSSYRISDFWLISVMSQSAPNPILTLIMFLVVATPLYVSSLVLLDSLKIITIYTKISLAMFGFALLGTIMPILWIPSIVHYLTTNQTIIGIIHMLYITAMFLLLLKKQQ